MTDKKELESQGCKSTCLSGTDHECAQDSFVMCNFSLTPIEDRLPISGKETRPFHRQHAASDELQHQFRHHWLFLMTVVNLHFYDKLYEFHSIVTPIFNFLLRQIRWLASFVRAMTSPRCRSYCSLSQDQEVQNCTADIFDFHDQMLNQMRFMCTPTFCGIEKF